jgi:hypothetical protein
MSGDEQTSELVKVGVSFDYEKRNIGEWKTAERSP